MVNVSTQYTVATSIDWLPARLDDWVSQDYQRYLDLMNNVAGTVNYTLQSDTTTANDPLLLFYNYV